MSCVTPNIGARAALSSASIEGCGATSRDVLAAPEPFWSHFEQNECGRIVAVQRALERIAWQAIGVVTSSCQLVSPPVTCTELKVALVASSSVIAAGGALPAGMGFGGKCSVGVRSAR